MYVDGSVRNCLLLHVLIGTGGVSSRRGFLVWYGSVQWLGFLILQVALLSLVQY